MVVVGRYLLRRGSKGLRNKKNCGVKRGKRKDKKRVPTTHHGLGPSLPLRLVKGWVTLWISLESGPMKRERYTCTNTSTGRIVRDAVSSFVYVCVCVCARGVQRVNITRGEKTGWRPCLVEEMFWSRGTFRSWPDLLFD